MRTDSGMKQLIERYKRLVQLATSTFHRYMYDKVNWSGRLVGIVGARGVGKTTMILHEPATRIYCNVNRYQQNENFYLIDLILLMYVLS